MSTPNSNNPRDYIATTTLYAEDHTVLAEPGQTCEKVPESSLGWLFEQGLIEQKPADSEEPHG